MEYVSYTSNVCLNQFTLHVNIFTDPQRYDISDIVQNNSSFDTFFTIMAKKQTITWLSVQSSGSIILLLVIKCCTFERHFVLYKMKVAGFVCNANFAYILNRFKINTALCKEKNSSQDL